MAEALSHEDFQRRLGFYHRSRAGKVLHAPLRMASTALKLGYCRAFSRVLPTRVTTFWGSPMHVMLPEPASIALKNYGFLEEGLTSLILRLLRPGMSFFDVGAHYGYFSLLAAQIVGPQGQVHAFEPSPQTFDVLRQNTAAVPIIRLNNLALYSQAGELTFKDFGVEFSEFNTLSGGRLDQETLRRRGLEPRQITVRAETLDRYVQACGAAPDFIKIDAEGAEMSILRGGGSVLRDVKPMITIEVAPDPADAPGASAQNVRFLEDLGYVPHEWSAGELHRHQRKEHYTFDNLLFIHPQGRKTE